MAEWRTTSQAFLSDDREQKDAFGLNYLRIIRFLLNTLGQWPNKEFGINTPTTRMLGVYRYVMIFMSLMCEALCIMYTWVNRKILNFFILGHLYGNIMTTGVLLQRSTLPFQKKYCALLKRFIFEFHLIHHEHESDFAKLEHKRINKFCRIITAILTLQICCGVTSFNVVPVYNNIRSGMFSSNRPENGTFDHSVFFELPFDYTTEMSGYIVLFFFNWYPCYNVSTALCVYDNILIVMVFHILGHFNIIANKMKSFPRPDELTGQPSDLFVQEYNKRAFLLLKDIIKHYEFIKVFVSEATDAFDVTLCAYLTFQQLNGCVLLLECSSMTPEALGKYGVLTLVVFQQLVQTSMIFEQINSKSDKLVDVVYEMPWELMDVKNRKIVLFFLRNVQNTLSVKALGVLPVGVMTMSAIIRTTVSYFVLLKTLAK